MANFGSNGLVADFINGWRIASVTVEERGPWKNRMAIDLECQDHAVSMARRGYMWAILQVPTRPSSPTMLGWEKTDKFENDDDRDLEVVYNNIWLAWGKKHELYLSSGRSRVTIPFILEQASKQNTFPPVQNLAVVGDVRPHSNSRAREITGKVKVQWNYDFQGKDAWFRKHYHNVHQGWWEHLSRKNPEGRCTAFVQLKSGGNTVQIQPYDPNTKVTGVAAEVSVHNPF